MHATCETRIKFQFENLKLRDHSEDLGVDERIIMDLGGTE
jgi:hypothetical protein